jgi:hypothetical protein
MVLVYIGISEALLYRLNEHYTTKEIIENHLKGNYLYGTLLTSDTSFFKLAAVKRKKPETVVLGSSRTTRIREKFFKNTTFYTMGKSIASVDDAQYIFNEITKEYTPQTIIFGVDLWWLNPNWHGDDGVTRKLVNKNIIEERFYMYSLLYNKLKKPARNKLIMEQIIKPTINERDIVSNRLTMGVDASNGSGYRYDGSRQGAEIILHPKALSDRISPTKKNIEDARDRFCVADSVDKERLSKLAALIKKIKQSGTHLIVFLPPFPDEIYQQMQNSNKHNKFLNEFEKSIKELCEAEGVAFYDFSDMAWFGSPDKEAEDGFHGSERAYARMMLKMADDEYLGNFINKEYIERRLVESKEPFSIVPYDE